MVMRVCHLAWKLGRVPSEWTISVTVPKYEGKSSRNVFENSTGKSLLSIPGSVNGRVLIKKVKDIT